MGAIGNYEVVSETFDFAAPNGQTQVVEVPPGKVALGWGAVQQLVSDPGGAPTGLRNDDLIIEGHPAGDGSAVTFVFTEKQGNAGVRSSGTLFVTCAEMGC